MDRLTLLQQLTRALEQNDGSIDKFVTCCTALKDVCQRKAVFTKDEETEVARTVHILIVTWKRKIERNAFLKWYSTPSNNPDHLTVPESFSQFYEVLILVNERVSTFVTQTIKKELQAMLHPFMDKQGFRTHGKLGNVSDRLQITLLSERSLSTSHALALTNLSNGSRRSSPSRSPLRSDPIRSVPHLTSGRVVKGQGASARKSTSKSSSHRHGSMSLIISELPLGFVPQLLHADVSPQMAGSSVVHQHLSAAARHMPATDFLQVPESPDIDHLGPRPSGKLSRTPSHRNMRILANLSSNVVTELCPSGVIVSLLRPKAVQQNVGAML